MISINKIDEVYINVDCDESVAHELSDLFTFEVPGAKFSPLYKKKLWDGKIRLFDIRKKKIYAGLRQHVIDYLRSNDYVYTDNVVLDGHDVSHFDRFLSELNLKFQPRDYQKNAVKHAVSRSRALLLSPTASGKSFIIYLTCRWYDQKTLVIVPTTSLVYQMRDDFISYGMDPSEITCILGGKEKESVTSVTISTWQSIYKLHPNFYEDFDVVIGDEAHLYKAKSLTTLMEKTTSAPYKFGFTGTLDGSQTNKLVLEGLFGPVYKVTTTDKLIKDDYLAEIVIKCLTLRYPDEVRKLCKGITYQQEIDYIAQNKKRNTFIKNLAESCKGNTLVLFQMVEKQGKLLDDMLKDSSKQVYYVDGSVNATSREEFRKIAEANDDVIIIASYGTFSTGINIKNLHNVIFASPTKSRVRSLQSIGRGLRKSLNKNKVTIYDLVDDIKHKNKENYTLKHFKERLKIYVEEKFKFKIYNYDL